MRSVSRSGRLAGLVAALSVAAALLVSLSHPAPAQAAVGDQPLISYNMQGATSGQDSKWTVNVGGYVQSAEIVALQEAGPTPPPPVLGTPITNIPQHDPNLPQAGLGNVVQSSLWQFGLASYNVYFLQTDANGGGYVGGRNNLALVTQRAADEVVALGGAPFGNGQGRGTLGVRFGNTWYFTLHALSNSGAANDADALLNVINTFVTGRNQNEQWIALGDYNRQPGAFPLPAGSAVYNSGQPTQQGGNELDYAVASNPANGVLVGRLAGASADHYAFFLGQLRAGAEPRERYSSDRALESMQSGGVLDADGGGTTNFTPIITYHRDHGANQSWIPEFHNDNTIQFQGRGSNRCLDIGNSNTTTAGRGLVLWDCVNQPSQRWTAEAVGDGEVQLHSVLRPDLCMNVSGGPTDPDNGAMIVWPCQDTTNERFLITPAEAPSDLDLSPIDLSRYQTLPRTMENLWAGGVLDADRGRTGNGTWILSWVRNGGLNQGWDLAWSDSQTVQFRGEASNRCIDIFDSNNNVGPGRNLVLWNCTDQASQHWRAVQLVNDQVELQNLLYPSLCMDIADSTGRPEGRMVVQNCTGSVSQQWLFTAFDPTGTPEHEHSEL